MVAIYVGIDVSKDRLDVHVRPGGEAFAATRDGKGLEELVERLRALSPTLIAVEATGGFEVIVAATIGGAGLPLVVVNPAQVRSFAQALGKRAKSDPIDAAIIAHFLAATKPQIRAAVELMFKTKVDSVTVANVRGKERRFGRLSGRRRSWKKAYVRLAEGQEINFAATE